jgi:hypothetical protein
MCATAKQNLLAEEQSCGRPCRLQAHVREATCVRKYAEWSRCGPLYTQTKRLYTVPSACLLHTAYLRVVTHTYFLFGFPLLFETLIIFRSTLSLLCIEFLFADPYRSCRSRRQPGLTSGWTGCDRGSAFNFCENRAGAGSCVLISLAAEPRRFQPHPS